VNARDFLTDIYQRRGLLTKEAVLEEAAPIESPIHDQFEWDDTEAAEAYRLVQAGQLIRKFKIIYRHTDDGEPIRVRQFVSVQRDNEDRPSYVPTGEAVADPITLAILQRECQREAAAFRSKYQVLADYAQIVRTLLLADEELTG
jgi:hypothetical protein